MAFSNPDQLLAPPVQAQPAPTAQAQQSNATAVLTKENLSNGDPANYELIAFISHMGESTAVSIYCAPTLFSQELNCSRTAPGYVTLISKVARA